MSVHSKRFLFGLMAGLMSACFSKSEPTIPPVAQTSDHVVRTTARSESLITIITNDPCMIDFLAWSCHDDIPANDNFTWNPDFIEQYVGGGFFCPEGCFTFPIPSKALNAINNELNSFIRQSPACQEVVTWLRERIQSGHMRLYNPPQDMNAFGDIHFQSRDVHIRTDMLVNPHELGMTLRHEGFHGKYGDPNDTNAEAFAAVCVLN